MLQQMNQSYYQKSCYEDVNLKQKNMFDSKRSSNIKNDIFQKNIQEKEIKEKGTDIKQE